jgi:transposase
MVLTYKVLEQGNFAWPKVQDGTMRLSRRRLKPCLKDWIGVA